jgi:hypothetical protein
MGDALGKDNNCKPKHDVFKNMETLTVSEDGFDSEQH